MAYIHEIALKNAIKKLYMLGSSDRKRKKVNYDGMANGAAGLVGAVEAKQAADLLKRQNQAAALTKRQQDELDRRDALVEGEEKWKAFKEKNFENDWNTSNEVGGNMLADYTKGQRRAVDVDGEVEAYDSMTAAQKADKAMIENEKASNIRFGGVYSPTGLKSVEETARKDAYDRQRLKGMLGIGGSLKLNGQ